MGDATSADEICRALGISLTLGAGSHQLQSVNAPPHSQIATLASSGPERGFEAVRDRRLAELLAILADGWEDLDRTGREDLATALMGIFRLSGVAGGRRYAALSRGSGGK